MLIFNRRKLWYLTQYAKFQYRVGRGNGLKQFFYGKIKTFFFIIMGLGTSQIVAQSWFNVDILKHIPWWVAVTIPIFELLTDYYVGYLDEKNINLMQVEAEIQLRRNLNPWETEKMLRLKNIEKAVAPKTYKKDHKTYIDERGKKIILRREINGGK